jgi:hypothetical protein
VLALLLAGAAFARPATEADGLALNTPPAPAVALLRFTATQQAGFQTPIETIEIEASLPKLNKNGWLRAIRRMLPSGRPEYQVLESGGDSMVKQEVIVRYLMAAARAAELPSTSIVITPANYKLQYAGAVYVSDRLAYVFRITPRKKRDGLINGVVWLDALSGAKVRQSGYLVKNPSLFIKHVDLTRENYFRNGRVDIQVTHMAVEARVVGTVRLVVVERPVRVAVRKHKVSRGSTAIDPFISAGSATRLVVQSTTKRLRCILIGATLGPNPPVAKSCRVRPDSST